MKLQLLNGVGIPFPLNGCDLIKAHLPYHSGVLEKAVDILDADSGKITVLLSDFELQGLKEGTSQTFWVVLQKGSEHHTFEFTGLLNVGTRDGRKYMMGDA
jgi:hypothetical protein